MITHSNKHFHKVISLFIKVIILLLSFGYIANKIANSAHTILGFDLEYGYLIIALILVPVNWGIETFKWKYLIKKIEYISFSKAFKSILSGVTIGIFTPNRMGEFAGRIFYLESDKIKATLISLLGSFMQLLVTVLLGIVSCFILTQENNEIKHTLEELISQKNTLFIAVLMMVSGLFLLLLFLYRQQLKNKYKNYKESVFIYSKMELLHVFLLSLLRYFVFTFQYYLILKMFNIDIGSVNSFLIIAVTFFVSSIIPTFTLTEMMVRGSSAIYFFSLFTKNSSAVMASSILIWIINIALPAILGGLFIWKLKLFKD